MKRSFTRIISFLVFISVISCGQPAARKEAKSAPVAVNDIPPVTLIEEGGKEFSAKELPGRSILIFFSSECDHCQRETKQIHNHLPAFETYSLHFVSMDAFEVMHKFAADYGVDGKPNIHFLQADGATVSRVLGYIDTPTMFIFDKDRKLVRRFDGETNIDEILRVL